jgi:hypothetical protein
MCFCADREQEEIGRAREAMKVKLFGIAGSLSKASQRQRLVAEVFKPGHILPTVTVEEFGEIEWCRVCSRSLTIGCSHKGVALLLQPIKMAGFVGYRPFGCLQT